MCHLMPMLLADGVGQEADRKRLEEERKIQVAVQLSAALEATRCRSSLALKQVACAHRICAECNLTLMQALQPQTCRTEVLELLLRDLAGMCLTMCMQA